MQLDRYQELWMEYWLAAEAEFHNLVLGRKYTGTYLDTVCTRFHHLWLRYAQQAGPGLLPEIWVYVRNDMYGAEAELRVKPASGVLQ